MRPHDGTTAARPPAARRRAPRRPDGGERAAGRRRARLRAGGPRPSPARESGRASRSPTRLTTTGPAAAADRSRRPRGAATRGRGRRRDRAPRRVPAYMWRDGCAPTSTGMVLGYWDGHGFPDLDPGRREHRQRPRPTRRSPRTAPPGAPGHYEDYALPKDDGGAASSRTRARRRRATSTPSDSVADFMQHLLERRRPRRTAGATPTWSGRRSSTTRTLRLTGVTAAYAGLLLRRYGAG